MNNPSEPYLSLVVATRNDDHGGNLMGRTQIFLDGWLTHALRYNIPSELIFVEWNPPAGRPPLAEALRWPADLGPCTVRFIEVPPELHQRYEHGAGLPLYQMIGKNVGIRRARGRFILATNIDILLSNELAAFLGERRLEPNRLYRIDRYDAMSDVPPDAPLDQQLAYCATHLLRINRREGTFDVTPDGAPALCAEDIAPPESGIVLGQGWFAPERLGPMDRFRWAQKKAEVILKRTPEPDEELVVELEPGPGSLGNPVKMKIVTDQGQILVRLTLDDRSRLHLQLPSPTPDRLWLQAEGEFVPLNFNTNTLCFRSFGFRWERIKRAKDIPKDTPRDAPPPARIEAPPRVKRVFTLWQKLQYVIGKLADGGPLVSLTVPVTPRMRRILKAYVYRGGITGILLGRPPRAPAATPAEAPAPETPVPAVETPVSAPASVGPEPLQDIQVAVPLPSADCLHTNASGDFQLAARENWLDLRGYAEFDMYSMNIDSAFCFTAHYGGAVEVFLPDPMRIYHIEHGSGSGWTPDGQQKLYARLAAKGIPVLDNEDVLRWAAHMRRLKLPMIFNHGNWGLGEHTLKETILGGSTGATAKA